MILTLRSDDVIHSFRVPNVAGKKDLVPGRETTHLIRVDHAGEFRGQCAEFCGAQHAWMALDLVAAYLVVGLLLAARWIGLQTPRRAAHAAASPRR